MNFQSLVDELSDALAAELKSRQTTRGRSMNELVTQTGLAVSFIGYIGRGQRRPSVETLAKIAWALDYSASEILGTVEPPVLQKKKSGGKPTRNP